MHSPRPYGLHTVGGELTDDDLTFIDHVARRLTNLKTLSGVASLKMVYDLPDGGFVIVQDAGGNFRAIVQKGKAEPEKEKKKETDGLAKDYVPMLFSGVITKAELRPDEGLGMRLSEMTRRRIRQYSGQQLPPRDVSLQRFRIDYNNMVYEFRPRYSTNNFHSQYVQQRPTWYSGAMAEVMQIVGGYGKQDFNGLPDNPIERAKVIIPDQYLKRIKKEIKDIRLPGYMGLPPTEGQFQFDYKFNSTHAIGFDDSRKPWLLKVDSTGVWAMPLPLIPATTTIAFREWMEEVGDDEILKILDRFGGMPSGEGFPDNQELAAWKRAGVVIKVCDVGDFYSHIAYSSACGWSFNLRGDEAVNTCYDYYDEEGLGYGLTYKMRLYLRSAANGGNLPAPEQPTRAEDLVLLNVYLGALLSQVTGTDAKSRAIKYKMRRLPTVDILKRAKSVVNVDENEVNYWDNLELGPIAAHSGNVAEIGRGYLYHPADFRSQPQIKFPEPIMGGCISHDFLPLINGRGKEKYPNSDTIMFGYYIGNSLKVVKYFADWRTFEKPIENDYDDCMIVGSWTQSSSVGGTGLHGNFYTSDMDYRDSFAPYTTVIKTIGKDCGYDSTPFFAFDYVFAKAGTLWRNRYFTHKTTITTTDGKSLSIGICIPYFCRNAVLHAKSEYTNGATISEGLDLYSVRDPTSYRYWTYDHIFAWHGGLEVTKGMPYPQNGNPVWVEIENYNPSQCSDFADQGSWIPGLPSDFTWLIHPDRTKWLGSGGGGPPKVNPYYEYSAEPSKTEGELMVSILDNPEMVSKEVPSYWYFEGSPNEYGDVFYRDGCKVVFGDAEYANVSEIVNGVRKHFGGTGLITHHAAYQFIGVING